MEQGIQQNLGALEEQLERLEDLLNTPDDSAGALSGIRLSAALDEIRFARKNTEFLQVTIDDNLLWDRCYPSSLILQQLNQYIVKEADELGIDVSVAQYSAGKIPHSVMEMVMRVITMLVKVCLSRMAEESRKIRIKSNRLGTRTIYVELRGGNDFLNVRILDDGPELSKNNFSFSNEFARIRDYVAENVGLCAFSFLDGYGFEFDLRVPVPTARISASILDYGLKGSFAFPAVSVMEVTNRFFEERLITDNRDGVCKVRFKKKDVPLCQIDPERGVFLVKPENLSDCKNGYVTIVGSADCRIAFLTSARPLDRYVRIRKGGSRLKKTAWHSDFALFNNQGKSVTLPFISGEVVVDFVKRNGKLA